MADSARFDEIDTRLESLSASLEDVRTHLGENTSTILTLQHMTSELLDIARLHQQGLRILQRDAEQDRAEIRRIWEYLMSQSGNGRGSS